VFTIPEIPEGVTRPLEPLVLIVLAYLAQKSSPLIDTIIDNTLNSQQPQKPILLFKFYSLNILSPIFCHHLF
jgi:hypothetical protein